jgi:CheY-like chemotaxis protein
VTATVSTKTEDLILVVEDDDDLRGALCEALQFEGIRCARAATGLDALEQLRAGLTPKAILLDLKMPEMGGVEFLRRRRTEGGAIAEIPVLVLTGDSRGSLATEYGASAVVRKPANVDTLLSALKPLLLRGPAKRS